MKRLLTLLCALALLVALIPAGAIPVSAGKVLVHRTETTLMEKILERDGFIEGIWYPWFTHTYLGCGLTSNELAAKWLNGWSGVTNCWYDFSKVGFDEYGSENIYREIYNLKSLGYNLLGYEGSIYGEGVIYDATGDVLGIKDEYLYNVRRFLDLCRDIGMPVLWTVTCHTSSVNQYYTNGKAFWDMACRFYADKTVADHYAERFVKPLAKVLAEYPDVVAMVASTSEAENEMNDSQVGNQFGGVRDIYGVSQENMLYFVNAVTEAVKAGFPSVPRTICCQLSDMSLYGDVDFDILGDQNYNWAGRSDPIEDFRSPVPMFVSEFGMGDDYKDLADADLTKVQITFRDNFRKTGYKGCVMWCWQPNSRTGSAYDLLKKNASGVTDFRSTAYDLYYYIVDDRTAYRGEKTVLDTPQLFCNTGNGLVEWIAPRQATKIDIYRSDDGGNNWIREVNNEDAADYVFGQKGQYVSEATPTANTVYKIVVRDNKGNERTSQVSNAAKDLKQFNTKYSGDRQQKTYDLSGYPLNLNKVNGKNVLTLSAVSVEQNRPTSASVNLLKEGSFETSLGGFTAASTLKAVSDTTAPDGSKSLYFDTSATTTADWHIMWVDVQKNTDYVFSAWVKGALLSADNKGYATLGVVDPATNRFIPYNSTLPFFTQSKQIVPPGWDNEWHLRSVSFNSGTATKVGIALYGCSAKMWVDGMALYKNGEGVKYVSKNMSQVVSYRYDVEFGYCAEKDSVTKNPTFESASFWKTGSGWNSGFLSIASNKYEYGSSLKYTATAKPVGQQYLKWVDVQPNTWYVFSVDIKILKSGAGRLVLLNGKMRNPDQIVSVEFDGDSFGDDWFTTCFRVHTGVFTRLAIGVVDGGGSALIDNLRLFENGKGIAGDDTYKDPGTGSTVAPPTATARPTGSSTTSAVADPSASTTAPTDTVVTDPTDAATDPTDTVATDPSAPADEDVTDTDSDAAPKDEPKTPWLLIGILGGAVVLIGGGLALFLFLRKKKSA